MSDGGSAADFDRGRRVGKYEILTRLSMGGMAELFLAYTSGPGGFRKFVAVKQILPDIKKDPQFVQMFLDEARITAALSHANIGQVFDLGQEDGELYLAMEFISGQNLEQVVKICAKRAKAIPYGFSARVVRDTCLGLHHAHNYLEPSGKPFPVIHRDVSPKNVMVTYQGNVKVIDFGIAKAKGRLGRTQVGIVKGTSGYMSPEQVRNEELDGRSDLFAAGVMLHELLAGRRLFAAAGDAPMMIQIRGGKDRRPPRIEPFRAAALSDVAMKALRRPREERFATGKEFARAIEAAAGADFQDEDQAAAFMRELFEDKMNKTRQLLDFASKSQDAQELDAAAGALREDPEAVERTPRPKARRSRVGDAPIAPKPVSQSAAPPPDTETTLKGEARKGGGAGRYVSKVAADYALYGESDADTVQDLSARRATADVPIQASARRVPVRRPAPGAPRASWGGRFVLLLLVAAVAGLGISTRTGPLQPYVAPLYQRAVQWAQEQFPSEPAPPPLQPLQRVALPAQAVSLIEKEKAAAEEAKKRAEAPPPPPVEEKPLPPPVAPKEVKESKAKKSPAAPKARPAAGGPQPLADGEVQVVDTRTQAGAARGGIGWLSLATVPPAQVYDGDANLGISPLVKVPLMAGTYRLRVVDPDGQPRMLSARIKPGETMSLKIRLADLPLDN